VPRRLTNLLLLGLALGLALTGLVGWISPDRSAGVWYELHRLLGVAVLLVLCWKAPIARGSLARRLPRPRLRASTVPGLLTGLCALGALALGIGWTLHLLDLGSFGGYSPLNVHVELGVLLLPLLGWHLARRWERKPALGALLSRRRTLVRIGALTVGTLAGWRLVDALIAGSVARGERRASASRPIGSFTGNAFTEEIWQFDAVPSVEPEAWRLEIAGGDGPGRTLAYADLIRLPTATFDAVLDCTGGWWTEQRWTGWRVDDVLRLADRPGLLAGDGVAEVVSVTGHRWTFPLAELRTMLLATHVGGEPISPGHGAPVRLVAPGRRGFQWVKWVSGIRALPGVTMVRSQHLGHHHEDAICQSS
jgi:DMSO/TMAO reductase YedYZ molybdopterin-dependent catalytic subunit